MAANLYKDEMISAQLFGKEVLYTAKPVFRDEVPEGWYCYDLCGTDRKPDQPVKLTDSAVVYRIGTVLSPKPLKRPSTLERKVQGQFLMDGRMMTLAEFCRKQDLPLPQDPRKYIPRPASSEEAGLFYALPPEKDAVGVPAGAQRSGSGGERRKERSGVEFSPQGGNGTGGVSSDCGAIPQRAITRHISAALTSRRRSWA